MANLKDIIYLSNEDYETLVSTGTVTINGDTLTYDENNVYVTPDKLASSSEDGLMSSTDKAKLDGIDISKLVTTDTAQDITGKKTLFNDLEFVQSSSGGGSNKLIIKNDNGYNAKIKMGNTENIRLMSSITEFGTPIAPLTDSNGTSTGYDVGRSNYRWKDLYLAGKIEFATNKSIHLDAQSNGILFENGSGTYPLQIYNNTVYVSKPINPTTTGINLGGSGSKYNAVFALYGQFYNGFGNGTSSDWHLVLPDMSEWSANKTIATTDDISSAITGLDLPNAISNTAGKTVLSINETDGIVSATFQDIEIGANQVDVDANLTLSDIIPAQVSSTNELADKNFVNSSIATNTAYFLGTLNIVTDLGLTTSATHEQVSDAIATYLGGQGTTWTNNDYVFVAYPDATDPNQFAQYDRYKYNAFDSDWVYEYTLNNSSFTAAQWAAINSGITAGQVATIANKVSGATSGDLAGLDANGDLTDSGVAANNVVTVTGDAQTISSQKTFSSDVYLTANIKPLVTGTRSVGTNSYRFNEGFINTLNTNVVQNASSVTIKLADADKYYFNTSQLMPAVANSVDLGRSDVAFKDLYLSGKINLTNSNNNKILKIEGDAYRVNFATQVAENGQFFNVVQFDQGNANFLTRSIIPIENNTFNLGSTYVKWKDAYFSGTIQTSNSISGTNNSASTSIKHSGIEIEYIDASAGATITNFSAGYDGNVLARGNLNLGGIIKTTDNFTYGFELPDTTNLTANSELVDTASAQTISGVKTFGSQGFKINSVSFVGADNNLNYVSMGSIQMYTTGSIYINANTMPSSDNSKDLGSSSNKWKNLFLSGYIGNSNSGYGLAIPDTTSFTANKTIATTDQLGTAAAKDFTTSVTSGSTDLVTSGAVYTAIDNLPSPMIFKGTLGTGGTITTLPSAASSNEGYTYKVITAGTYASQSAQVGDVFTSNGSEWVLIPSGDDTTSDTWRAISVNGTQLLGSSITTGGINFKNGGNITVSGSGSDITLGVASGYSIPSTTNQSAWSAKYDKPSGGIPASDLAESYSLATNIENGSGTNAIQEKRSHTSINFTGRNANAEALDSSLSTTITTGGTGENAASFNGNTMSVGSRAFAINNKTIAKGDESMAQGYCSVALGSGSHAEGNITVSKGDSTHSEGYNTQAIGNNSHAEGSGTTANSLNSHVEGYATQTLISDSTIPNIPAYSDNGSSGGSGSTPGTGGTTDAQVGDGAHAEGSHTTAVGNFAHAEGTNTWASGASSHAEGYGSQATYDYAHAEGYNTLASGYGSHSTGLHTIASGNYSFTQGQQTEAVYNLSSAFGKGTHTDYENQMSVGRWNSYETNALFVVGNGNNHNDRSTAFKVDKDGHAEVGLMGNTNKSVVLKEYVDSLLMYLTTTPTSANTTGMLKVVVLSSEPATKYDGYIYIITGSN